MIEAWWRSLKHQWLFLHALDSVSTIRRLVAFYVHDHNHVLPHSFSRTHVGLLPDVPVTERGRLTPGLLTAVPTKGFVRSCTSRRPLEDRTAHDLTTTRTPITLNDGTDHFFL